MCTEELCELLPTQKNIKWIFRPLTARTQSSAVQMNTSSARRMCDSIADFLTRMSGWYSSIRIIGCAWLCSRCIYSVAELLFNGYRSNECVCVLTTYSKRMICRKLESEKSWGAYVRPARALLALGKFRYVPTIHCNWRTLIPYLPSLWCSVEHITTISTTLSAFLCLSCQYLDIHSTFLLTWYSLFWLFIQTSQSSCHDLETSKHTRCPEHSFVCASKTHVKLSYGCLYPGYLCSTNNPPRSQCLQRE